LCLLYSMLSVSLDCPFLISTSSFIISLCVIFFFWSSYLKLLIAPFVSYCFSYYCLECMLF
jgi:hypothetical protein